MKQKLGLTIRNYLFLFLLFSLLQLARSIYLQNDYSLLEPTYV